MSMLLKVRDLNKGYGPISVLKSVSFDVANGETFCIIGPNGAGKTTLFKSITGEVGINSGSIVFRGTQVRDTPAFVRTRMGMGRTFQVSRVFLAQDVFANVVVAVEARRNANKQGSGRWFDHRPSAGVRDEAAELLRDVGLLNKAGLEARFLSHGDKKKLELALALALEPAVLLLDEPTAGMSASSRMGIVELIARIKREREISVVMVEHDMDVIFSLAERVMVLNYGEIVMTGTLDEVRASPVVREVYLGKEIYVA